MKKSLGSRLKELFKKNNYDTEFFEEIEDALVEADLGSFAASGIVDELKIKSEKEKLRSREELYSALKEIISNRISGYDFSIDADNLNLILFLGVNGVGKTTTIAKTAAIIKKTYPSAGILLSAADTFRAAASQQLQTHGSRLGVRVLSQGHGSDPGAVIFDSIESAKSKGEKVILADTAGRMHNKANLVKELQKIDKIIRNKINPEYYRKFLVIDATTGQNGLNQAEAFNEALGIDAVVISKFDSAARGGIAVSISGKLKIPVVFIGTGEKYEDLKNFDKNDYLERLLNE